MNIQELNYREIFDINSRISFLENKKTRSPSEHRELAQLELDRILEYRKLGRELVFGQDAAS